MTIHDAWARIHEVTPLGWSVGRPGYDNTHHRWTQYAFDPSERAEVGRRSREWLAIAESEIAVMDEMAKCLEAISEGRAPR